jgi:hypothetical protein
MLARLSSEFPPLSNDGGGTRPFAGIGMGCLSVLVVGSDETEGVALVRESTAAADPGAAACA